MILCIKTDSPEVYIGLWKDGKEQAAESWQAGRELSGQILGVIDSLCKKQAMTTADLAGVVVYEGPGSYTGLRIGMSVANALGASHSISVVGTTGDEWLQGGFQKLEQPGTFTPISPVYGGEVRTTRPKK